MEYTAALLEKLEQRFGSPFYIFDERGFEENYLRLQSVFRARYSNYHIAYSFKTNYTPYIVSAVKRLGGWAEVVSGMEYSLARRLGFENERIIFNGPDKGSEGKEAFLNGAAVNVDSLTEAEALCRVAEENKDKKLKMGIRVNLPIGRDFVSRFGINPSDVKKVFETAEKIPNLKISGLHCHISRCRDIEAWRKRAELMLGLAQELFPEAPEYIDLGSGMFGSMHPDFAAQFTDVPSYEDYAEVTAALMNECYGHLPEAERPVLFTEPGTTLINRFVDFAARVDIIKELQGKYFAVMNCSTHNLGETCTLKELPLQIFNLSPGKSYEGIDLVGYTCLEQDLMRKNLRCTLAPGDRIVFGNVGGYSNVLKPPFIKPNCPMLAIDRSGEARLIKKRETYEEIFQSYVFD